MWLQSRFTMMRNHASPAVDEVGKLILSHQDWTVSESSGYILLNNEKYAIKFWSGYTKYFAYMQSGMINNKLKSQSWDWDDCRPNRLTLLRVYRMVEELKRQSFIKNFSSTIGDDLKRELKVIEKEKVPKKINCSRMLRPIIQKKWWNV
jgi:hypothetical protein